MNKCSNFTSSFLFGLVKFAINVKSPFKYLGESKYRTLRLAFDVSNTGFLGLIDRKMTKVPIPNNISSRQNIMHSIAAHHTAGFVRLRCRGTTYCTIGLFLISCDISGVKGFHGSEDSNHLIQMHKNLVGRFFGSAKKMLRVVDQIHVTHKTAPPYDLWDLVGLGSGNSLICIECADFKRS
ncbi:hypothetical protein H5410_039255 [Solanum commersonii]|uniref:25S rRNA (uridine-N(3))-methyltransferase BMT5-like domain-containing protein n=1 Tax=Solanum commersonii TaxID=4109 RepID=A0A9J5YDT3_SOLCO|nr:hypothetical protein H5410_039255 [Solanum commersonii]